MSTNYKAKIFSNFFALSVVQGANFLIPLVIMPYVISRIGIDWFGVISVAQVTMIYLSTIADYGFNLTATREVALYRNEQDTEKISRFFFTVLSTKIIITALLFLVLLVLVSVIPFFKTNSLLYTTGFAYVIGQSLLVSWFFQGIEKMKFVTYSVLLARIVFVVLVFLFIKGPGDSFLFLFFFGLGSVLAGFYSIYKAVKNFKLRFLFPRWSDVLSQLKDGWQIMISSLSANVYLFANVFILRIFVGDLIVGYYSIAEKIFLAIRQMLSVFSQAIYPHICQLTEKSKNHTVVFFKKVYQPFLLLVIVGCSVVFIFSSPITQLFAGKESDLPGFLLRILSIVPIIVCLNIPANLLLLSLNQKKSYFRISILGTMINLLANIVLADVWGATGTVIAIIITEVFITIGLNIELYRNNLTDYIRLRAT